VFRSQILQLASWLISLVTGCELPIVLGSVTGPSP
jgi:hypothetical protein